MTRTRTWLSAAALLAAVALLAAACEGDGGTDPATEDDQGDAGAQDGGDEMTSLTVGDIQGTPSAFLEFAVQEGFFEAEGLEVTVEANPGGAANIPGVEAGDFEIAGSNIVSVLLARGEGLELRMVSAGTFGPEDPEDDFSRIVVPGDSDISGPEDLNGRSVAVNTLANIAELTTRAALENVGAEHEDIDFVEMPFPDMVPAVQDGQVDAAFVIEPFASIGLDQGLQDVLSPYAQTAPNLAVGSYFSSDAYIEENPEVIDRFVAGVTAAGEHIEDNQQEFRDALVDLAGLEPGVAEMVHIPSWGGPVDVDSVELIGDLMVRYELFDEAPPTDEVVYQP